METSGMPIDTIFFYAVLIPINVNRIKYFIQFWIYQTMSTIPPDHRYIMNGIFEIVWFLKSKYAILLE